jgi:hypothetical protein
LEATLSANAACMAARSRRLILTTWDSPVRVPKNKNAEKGEKRADVALRKSSQEVVVDPFLTLTPSNNQAQLLTESYTTTQKLHRTGYQ